MSNPSVGGYPDPRDYILSPNAGQVNLETSNLPYIVGEEPVEYFRAMFFKNPSKAREEYAKYKNEVGKSDTYGNPYNYAPLDNIVKPWGPHEEIIGLGISGAEGFTWNALDTGLDYGHPVTNFAGNVLGSLPTGNVIVKKAGVPFAKKALQSHGLIRGLSNNVATTLNKMKIPVTAKNTRRWSGVLGLSVPEAIIGGVADGIRERSLGEALTSMPYWFLVGVAGNTFGQWIKQARRRRKVRLAEGRYKDNAKEDAEILNDEWELTPEEQSELTNILEGEFQGKLGLSMGEFDQILKDFSQGEVNGLLLMIEHNVGGKQKKKIKQYITDVYNNKHLGETAIERVSGKIDQSNEAIVNREIDNASRSTGVADADASLVKQASVSSHAMTLLESMNLIPKGAKVDKVTDWTKQPEVPFEIYVADEAKVVENINDDWTLDSIYGFYGKKKPSGSDQAESFMRDEAKENPYVADMLWKARVEAGPPLRREKHVDPPDDLLPNQELSKEEVFKQSGIKTEAEVRDEGYEFDPEIHQVEGQSAIDAANKRAGKPTDQTYDERESQQADLFDSFIEERRPLVTESKKRATIEKKEPVTTLDNGDDFKGTPEDYKNTLQDELKVNLESLGTTKKTPFGDVEITSPVYDYAGQVSFLNSWMPRWLSNVNPVFEEGASKFKNIRVTKISDIESWEETTGGILRPNEATDGLTVGMNRTTHEPELIYYIPELLARYRHFTQNKITKDPVTGEIVNLNSFDEFVNEQISIFYGNLRRGSYRIVAPLRKLSEEKRIKEVEKEAAKAKVKEGSDEAKMEAALEEHQNELKIRSEVKRQWDEGKAEKVEEPLDLDDLVKSEPEFQKDITEAENLKTSSLSSDGSGETFKGVSLVEDPFSLKPAFYNRETKTIVINSVKLEKKYTEKAWTNPTVVGVDPMPDDAFHSLDEWKEFVLHHERTHHDMSFDDFKKLMKDVGADETPTEADYENWINAIAYYESTGREFGKPKDAVGMLRELLDLDNEVKALKTETPSGQSDAMSWLEGMDLLPFNKQSNRRAFDEGVLPDDIDMGAPAIREVKEMIVNQVQFLSRVDDKVFDATKIPKNLTNGQALQITDWLHDRISVARDKHLDEIIDGLDNIAYQGSYLSPRGLKGIDAESPDVETVTGKAVSANPDPEVIKGAEVLKDELGDQATTWFGLDMEWLMGTNGAFGISKNRYVRDFLVRYAQSENDSMGLMQEQLLSKYFKVRELLGVDNKGSISNQKNRALTAMGIKNVSNQQEQRLYKLAEYLDKDYTEGNNPLAKVPEELKADKGMYEAFLLYRELMDDVANLLKLPKDKRITGYLAHIFGGKAGRLVGQNISQKIKDKNTREVLENFSTMLNTEGKSLDEILDSLEGAIGEGLEGSGYRGLFKRTGSEDYTFDLDSITMSVIYGSTQKDFTQKIALRANDVLANIPMRTINKAGVSIRNPMRASIASAARHIMGKPTPRRELIAATFSNSEMFNRGVDRLVELIGGAPKGLNLSMPKRGIESKADNQMRLKSIEWLDDLERTCRIVDWKTGEPTKNLRNNPTKFLRASIALQIQDLRNALNNKHLSGPVANAMYRAMIVSKLGMNVSHAMLNLTQVINTASKLELRYVKHGLADAIYQNKSEINGRSVAAIVEESGIKRDVTSTEEFLGMKPSLLKDVQEGALYLSRKSETFNREVALLGAYRKHTDIGKSHSEAMTFARNIVNETQHTFDRTGTPPILRGSMMRLIAMFQSYTIHQTSFAAEIGNNFRGEWSKQGFLKALQTEDGLALRKYAGGTIALMGGSWLADEAFDTDIAYKTVPPFISTPLGIIQETPRRGFLGATIENLQGPAADLSVNLIDGTTNGLAYVYYTLMNMNSLASDSADRSLRQFSDASTSFVPTTAKKIWNYEDHNWKQILGLQKQKKRQALRPVRGGGSVNSSMIGSGRSMNDSKRGM